MAYLPHLCTTQPQLYILAFAHAGTTWIVHCWWMCAVQMGAGGRDYGCGVLVIMMSIVSRVTGPWEVPVSPLIWGGLTYVPVSWFTSAHSPQPHSSPHPLIQCQCAHNTVNCQHAILFISACPHSGTTHPSLHMLGSTHAPACICTLFCRWTCCKSIISMLTLYFTLTLVFQSYCRFKMSKKTIE